MLTFERTSDMDLVRLILTDPKCWRRMTDDQAPPPEEFRPTTHPDRQYILALVEGSYAVAVFVLVERGTSAEVHFCFSPDVWGVEAEGIAKAFLRWVWENTPINWLIGPVPEHNRLALALAKKAGLTEFAIERAAVRKRGKTFDRVLMQITRPLPPGGGRSHEQPIQRARSSPR